METKSIKELECELIKEKVSYERTVLSIQLLNLIFNGGILNRSDIIQLVGETMTYKTSLALQISKSYCKQKKHVLYIDSSGGITDARLDSYGLLSKSKEYFHFYKKSSFDDVCSLLDKFISTNELSLIVIDSVADLINKGYFNLEQNSKGKTSGIEVDNKNSNYDSKPLSSFIKKYTKLATNKGYSMILINQMRTKMVKKIGTVARRYGPKILDYSCTYILHLSECKSNELFEGMSTLDGVNPFYINVIKSSNSLTGKKYPVLMESGKGISERYLIIRYLLKKDIKKDGTYYQLEGTNIKENGLTNFIRSIPETVLTDNLTKALVDVMEYYKTI